MERGRRNKIKKVIGELNKLNVSQDELNKLRN
jgi:hypothetical protein